jgi:hypothetical protein
LLRTLQGLLSDSRVNSFSMAEQACILGSYRVLSPGVSPPLLAQTLLLTQYVFPEHNKFLGQSFHTCSSFDLVLVFQTLVNSCVKFSIYARAKFGTFSPFNYHDSDLFLLYYSLCNSAVICLNAYSCLLPHVCYVRLTC